jgi:hypothetical protein
VLSMQFVGGWNVVLPTITGLQVHRPQRAVGGRVRSVRGAEDTWSFSSMGVLLAVLEMQPSPPAT